MCLKVTRDKPWNKNKLRWKFAIVSDDGQLYAPYRLFPYSRTGWMRVDPYSHELICADRQDRGFHVYVDPLDAWTFARVCSSRTGYDVEVMLVEVDDFNSAGTWENGRDRNETWYRMRIKRTFPFDPSLLAHISFIFEAACVEIGDISRRIVSFLSR